jgi:6-phosphogluconolactonase
MGSQPCFAYVGSYTTGEAPDGGAARGAGIYVFQRNPASGALLPRDVVPSRLNPSWLAVDQAGRCLYSANETKPGSMSAYSIDPTTGSLRLLNTESSEGDGPCHLSVHPSGDYVLVANYAGNSIAVLPIGRRGELGPATDVVSDGKHPHMIQADPTGRFIVSSDLGSDRLRVWRLDARGGKLIPQDRAGVRLPAGSGPRHFAFHPDGRSLYSLQEQECTVTVFDNDPSRCNLTFKQTVSMHVEGLAGSGHASELVVTADGRFIYAANRRSDRIVQFTIQGDGTLVLTDEVWSRGSFPRSLAIAPGGKHLYSCNQRGDAIACFSINRETGGLALTGNSSPVGTPAVIVFLK